MARTELYEDSRGALLKSVRAAEFCMAWNMTNQWRNQRPRRPHVARNSISETLEAEMKRGRKKTKGREESKRERRKEVRKGRTKETDKQEKGIKSRKVGKLVKTSCCADYRRLLLKLWKEKE